MTDSSKQHFTLPPEQQAIRDKCCHPSGQFDPFPADDLEKSIQIRFEKIVERYPERIAVKAGNEKITYSALNKAANRLAHCLLGLLGEGQEVVGFSHAHGILPLVSHLAVLKAGKFSVQLDPTAPKSRNAHIMVDSTARILLTDNNTISAVGDWISGEQILLNLDDLDSNLNDQNPNVLSSSEDVVYIRYTSGSTGQAKGAIKTHRHLLHEVMVATNCFRLCKQDRIAHLSRGSTGKNVFFGLLNGATLCPLDTKQGGLVHLADWLVREEITMYQSFPTAFRYFTSSLDGHERFSSVRLIRLEGELLYNRDIKLYRKYFPPECVLVNSYSSAETGTVSLYFIDHKTTIAGNGVPMGYPLEGKQVMLLDDHGNDVGVNQVGEIAVKSQLLSAGYWHQADITEQKFSRDPTGLDGQTYLTGDLGAVSEHGLLQHFGRKDLQVKIRSFRVDAGEVEAMLAEREDIKEAVVVAQDDQLGNKELVAYTVTRDTDRVETSTLRNFLHERLPEYMVPAHFVKVENIPLTATGKVDRLQLAVTPNNLRLEHSRFFVAPRTAVEEEIACIWQQMLSLDRVGVHDNFFELGGHSLLATHVMSRVAATFAIDLPLSILFERPTIACLAESIDTIRSVTKPLGRDPTSSDDEAEEETF